MAIDPKLVSALSEALDQLRTQPHHPTPTSAIAALAPVARPGLRLSIDLAASRLIGAPLITIADEPTREEVFSALTKRQREVARLVTKGCSNREIADTLGISIATVKDHVHAILQRLGKPSRAAVIAAARSSIAS